MKGVEALLPKWGKPEKLKSKIPAFIALGLALLLIGIDRLTKGLVVANIAFRTSITGIRLGGFELVNIAHVRNYGAAFGILEGRQSLLIGVTGGFLIGAVIALFLGRFKSKLMLASITLIIAGGIGNLIDRVMLGYVVDFIELRFINFAIFNFADICAVSGAVLLAVAVFADELKEWKSKKQVETESDE